MIPEKEREALMRLTMCAREECGMCKYEEQCDNWDFRMELATKNMNILAEALRKTEPITHDDYIESENDYLEARCLNCNNAKACKEKHWDGCVYEPKYEGNCSEKPNNCEDLQDWKDRMWTEAMRSCGFNVDGYRQGQPKTEPQTDIHGLTDCDFCKGENCEDCEGGKDEPPMDCKGCKHWKGGCDIEFPICKRDPVEDEPQLKEDGELEILTQTIEFPDTHQRFMFTRSIRADGDCLIIGDWEYKGKEDEPQTKRSE